MNEFRSNTVATLGEALIRLFPDDGSCLEQTDRWNVSVGGAEANVAVALAQLGVRARWISKLPNNPVGRKVVRVLRSAGVDVDYVLWTEYGRVGIYFTERGITQEDLTVWYDRSGSTFTTINAKEIEWAFLDSVSLVHLTGITPALGQGPLGTVETLLENATTRGLRVSLDVNYRAQLWGPEQAREVILDLFRGKVDLVICSSKDARTVFGIDGDGESAVRQLQEEFGAEVAVLTRGAKSPLAWDGRRILTADPYTSQALDRIGRGDAFVAGVINGFLVGDLDLGLRQGCVLAAMAQARRGDHLIFYQGEVYDLMNNGPHERR